MNVNKKKIRHLIRNTLGCTCPEEVIDHIVMESIPEISGISGDFVKIIVGNRLLVLIWFSDEYHRLPEPLPFLMQAGQAQRDRMHLNRFRLVIGTHFVEETKRRLPPVSSMIDPWDEKCHLHIVNIQDMEFIATWKGSD